ncbi:hypothetical protein TDB9533_04259 [Thalassocella blandensis]|nr:hypothetical protein TDB9533_04259 [Thalassocella blandensis]
MVPPNFKLNLVLRLTSVTLQVFEAFKAFGFEVCMAHNSSPSKTTVFCVNLSRMVAFSMSPTMQLTRQPLQRFFESHKTDISSSTTEMANLSLSPS